MKKVWSLPMLVILSLTLTSCSSDSSATNNKTPLQLNAKSTKVNSDKDGHFLIKLTAPKNAKITAYYENDAGTSSGNYIDFERISGQNYEGTASLSAGQENVIVSITAKQPGKKKNTREILIDNASRSSSERASIKKVKAAESRADSGSWSREDASDSVAEATSESKESATYPDVNTALPNGILNYSTSTLIQTQFKLTGTVTDLGADGMKQYHILITGDGDSKPEYLLVIPGKKTGKVTLDDDITVWGGASGVSKLNQTQVNVGISPSYKNTKVALLMADKVEIN